MQVIAGKLDAWDKKCDELTIPPPKNPLLSATHNQLDLVLVEEELNNQGVDGVDQTRNNFFKNQSLIESDTKSLQ